MTFSRVFQYLCRADNVKNLPWKINNIQYLVLYKPGALYFQRHFQHEFSCGNIRKDSFSSVRRSRLQMFFKICHLKHFANFARKYLCRSVFIIKLKALGQPCNLIIKRLQHRSFPVMFVKLLRTSIFTEQPYENTSDGCIYS